jgi:hypothetical protein
MQGIPSSTVKSLNIDIKPIKLPSRNCLRMSQQSNQGIEGFAAYDCQREHGLKSCFDCFEYPKEWKK